MDIFVDLDDTLFNTSSVLTGNSVGEILIAELRAPLFDGAHDAIKALHDQGHTCWVITSRGLNESARTEEESITISRIKSLFKAEKNYYFIGWLTRCGNKYSGINKAWHDYYKKEVDGKNSILIDDDLAQVLNAKQQGVNAILFAAQEEDAQTQALCREADVHIAHSWADVKQIVDEKIAGKGYGE